MKNLAGKSPREIRELIRTNQFNGPTAGVARGYAQANLAVLKKEDAFSFLLFCQRNQKPCPLLDVTEPGSPIPSLVAPEGDIRTDIGSYRIYRNGELSEEVQDITPFWEDDMVGFLIGCSFTFEHALINNGIPIRHIDLGCNVPMYKSNIACTRAGKFDGNMVVSMRPVKEKDVVRAVQVTSRFPAVHGGPVHIGSPETIGIQDLAAPDFGDAVSVDAGEVPVFWACGVTPQAVAMHAKPELMITHSPGHMFVTDVSDEQYGVL